MRNNNSYDLLIEILKHEHESRIDKLANGIIENPFINPYKIKYEYSGTTFGNRYLRKMSGIINKIDKSISSKTIEKEEDSDEFWYVDGEIMSLNFLIYILQHKPDIPLEIYDSKDSQTLINYVRSKLYIGAVRVFPKSRILDSMEFNKLNSEYQSNINISKEGYWESYGFKSVVLLDLLNGLSSLVSDYYLDEFHNHIEKQGYIFDIGSFIGDSAYIFRKYLPNPILCFEPDSINRKVLQQNIILNNINNISVTEEGVSNKSGEISVMMSGAATKVLDDIETDNKIKITTIDEISKQKDIPKISLIKMDIEGEEYNALLGGEEMIRKDKPMLIISLYHGGKDFFEIPKLIRSFSAEYKFRFLQLDKRLPASEFVLLAYIENRKGAN